jgi:hypothetical protein
MPEIKHQILNKKDFGDLAGTSKQNIGQLITKGTLEVNDDGLLDTWNQKNHVYLLGSEQRKSKVAGHKAESYPQPTEGSLDELKKKTEKQRGIKLEIENKTKRNELIPRESVARILARLHMIDETMFKNLGQNCAPDIMAIGGIVEDSKQIEIQANIDDAVHRILNSAKKQMDDFLNEFELINE